MREHEHPPQNTLHVPPSVDTRDPSPVSTQTLTFTPDKIVSWVRDLAGSSFAGYSGHWKAMARFMSLSAKKHRASDKFAWAALYEAFEKPIGELADQAGRNYRDLKATQEAYRGCKEGQCNHPRVVMPVSLELDICEANYRGITTGDYALAIPEEIRVNDGALAAFRILMWTISVE